MDEPAAGTRLPLAVAVVAAVAIAALLLAPVVAIDAEWHAIQLYLGGTLGGLWVVAGLGAVVAIVALAGATGRTDPVLAASIVLGMGTILLVVAVAWALGVDGALVEELSPATWFAYHRFGVVVLAAAIPASGLWAAKRVGVF